MINIENNQLLLDKANDDIRQCNASLSNVSISPKAIRDNVRYNSDYSFNNSDDE